MTTSPPTDRVVAVVESLVSGEQALRISELSRRLGQSRSTCTAIVAALELHGWVERAVDGGYVPGGRLVTVGSRARAGSQVLTLAAEVLRGLSDRNGAVSALTHYTPAYGTIVFTVTVPELEVVQPVGQDWSFPVVPPLGASVIAHADRERTRRWLDRAPDPATRRALAAFLDAIRSEGVAVWRFDDDRPGLSDFLALVQRLGPAAALRGQQGGSHDDAVPQDVATDDGVDRMLAALGAQLAPFGYGARELKDPPRHVPVSHLTAPVFDLDGMVRYELSLRVLDRRLPARTLVRLLRELRTAADELGRNADPAPRGASPKEARE
jgi:DNA-binding IclR family transcriptional regulator